MTRRAPATPREVWAEDRERALAQHEPFGDDPVEWIARLQRPLYNSHFRDDDRTVIEMHLTRLRETLLRLRESRMKSKV